MNRIKIILAGSALLIGLSAFADMTDGKPTMEGEINRASFTRDNRAFRPNGWREWVFIGSPVTPNALNGGEAAFPEFHNVYIEPSAYHAFMKTGKFPEGTQIVKELVSIQVNDTTDKDGSTIETSGRGFFQNEFIGLELLVKDNVRFADEPGGWAFFSFAHNSPDYADIASILPVEKCSACHQANAATDYVFTQHYPVLSRPGKIEMSRKDGRMGMGMSVNDGHKK